MFIGKKSQRAPTQTQLQGPVFRKGNNYHSVNPLLVRDSKGRFVSNLTKDDFDVFEDGVRQNVEVFYPVIGGRPMNMPTVSSAPVRPTGGLILPKARSQQDSSGRVFVILIDDMSILGEDTMLARQVLKQVRDNLVQDTDLVGIVSSGYSSIQFDLAYDYGHVRMDEAIDHTMGGGMTKDEIVTANETSEGPAGLRYMAHTAMKTARDILERAAEMTDKRKAFIYISEGYDFDPFKDSRLKYEQDALGISGITDPNDPTTGNNYGPQPNSSLMAANADPFYKEGNRFADADLVNDEAELIRIANRSNMTIYTIDPRGLIAGPSLGGNTVLTQSEWTDFVHTTVDSLTVLADGTGGFCICNTNDFKSGLERINNETSDYYVLGYNSTNPDPLKVVRRVDVRSKKPGLSLQYTPIYTLPRPKKSK